ncbi:hypothetical protein CLV63_103341 [Murinocardiopsis flavida]|uniref:Uncharacterized protein n=1 Tax=Murinocardiopsis flavida TaxID=645275 RepID=A0A2P8DQX5_9ACTN|nr:hypothetical protein [Murinocardiopsis flavida]PSK99616.1 hypothetical protein CLV63_103341 [Murinocardiopsis flavida]
MADARSQGPKRSESTLIGWRHEVLVPEPGPPPRRPAPAEREGVSSEWIETQRRTEADTNRPLTILLGALGVLAAVFLLLWPLRILPGILAVLGSLACLLVAIPVLVALSQGRHVVRERLTAEERRLTDARAEKDRELRELQEEHARRHNEWQTRKRTFEAQPRWFGLGVPKGTGQVDVFGGSDAGWSAAVTSIGGSLLRSGGDLTVVDLSGRAVAADLVALTQKSGVMPRIWVLPVDLPRMNLGLNLDTRQRAAILAQVISALDPKSDLADDNELFDRLLRILGPKAGVAEIIGALRALVSASGEGAAEQDDPSLLLLSADQRARVQAECGDDRAVLERAWRLEQRLTPFEGLGSRAEDEPYAQVKVIATDRSAGDVAGRAYGTYTVAALSELLELRARRGDQPLSWGHTIVICGADTLPHWHLELLEGAARRAGFGVVLMYRRIPDDRTVWPGSAERMPVLMRQPDTESAERAAAQLGGEHAPPVHRLTEVIGEALSDAIADSYVGDPASSITMPIPTRYVARSVAPLDLARNLRAVSTWGRATAQAAEIDDAADSGAAGRVRGLRLDALGLRSLPPTAMVVLDGGTAVVADANPGILTLPTATLATVAEKREEAPAAPPGPGPDDGAPANIGPPPERLDWRRSSA